MLQWADLQDLLWRARARLGWRGGDSAALPATLRYTGEFGPELVLFLPFVTWASQQGLLRQRRISTYAGMGCFYDEIDCLGVTERRQRRRWVPPARRPAWLPVRDEHSFDGKGRPDRHVYPDLRAKFLKFPAPAVLEASGRPLLVIHNKHNDEWGMGPVNHIPLATLSAIFRRLQDAFTIVYVRHGMRTASAGFVEDHNRPQPFDDAGLLAHHPAVLGFDDLHDAHRAAGGTQDVNTFKNVLYSRCYRFISSQGGGAHQIAMFGGSLLVVLHRRGQEERWAYADGYYGFMAPVPPILAICRTEQELLEALPLLSGSAGTEDRLLLDPACAPLLARLSPRTMAERAARQTAASMPRK